MKTLLICPAHRPAVSRLAENQPLVLAPIMGKCVLEYWLDHLVSRGDRDVRIIALDRTDQVRELVGDGSRWGLHIEVIPASESSDTATVRALRHAQAHRTDSSPPDDVILMDHLPGFPKLNLFESYEGWFKALQAWMPHAATPDRIGRREVQPGVSVGLHARISPSARLIGPCWIGENVFVGPDAVIGPHAILEDRAFVECGSRIERSVVAPETFVGELTLVEQSLACGNLLINWKTRSCLEVPDAFLMCSLGVPQTPPNPLGWMKTPLLSLRDLIPRQQERPDF